MLANVRLVVVGSGFLTETRSVLQKAGERGYEALVLWAGIVRGERAEIVQLLVPEQNPIREEGGVGYFVEGPTLFNLSRYLQREKLRLIAQIHSHPYEAYHSETDDRYAIVTEEGGFSLVVPDFARRPLSLDECAIYRLFRGAWCELDERAVVNTFRIDA